jgi:hypothetical protein
MPTKPTVTATTAAEAAAPAITLPKKISLQLRVLFTKEEMLEKGRQIAEAHQEAAQIENEFATVKTQFKARSERVTSKISELSSNITSGFEYRSVTCEVRLDDPKPGIKTTVRLDTSETVSVDQMTPAELQKELALADPADPAETVADPQNEAPFGGE